MYLKLDPKEYGRENYGVFLLNNSPTKYFIRQGFSDDNKFTLFDVADCDMDEVTALIQKHFGAVERGGNPDHDCTGLPFRYGAAITSSDNNDGTCDVTFFQSEWMYDI